MKKLLVFLMFFASCLLSSNLYAQNKFCLDNGSDFYIHMCSGPNNDPKSCPMVAGGIINSYTTKSNSIFLYASSLCKLKTNYDLVGTITPTSDGAAAHIKGTWTECSKPNVEPTSFSDCDANAQQHGMPIS